MAPISPHAGRYRLESLLARGGLAEVWLAKTAHDGAVAVKRPLDGSPWAAVEALRREASIGKRLSHPAIVRLIDSGAGDSGPYLVFEYVDGPSLREQLALGPMTEAACIEMGCALLEALSYAHGRGVVHNDLKPENILLGPEGPKIADFGAAQSLTETVTAERARELSATIAYLAPEVLQGAEPSPASDVYSLGLTLYEAVAGRLPFSGPAALIAGQRVTTGVPPLRRFAPAASPHLERTLARALEPDPGLRFTDAAAFAAALRPVHEPTVVIERPSPAGGDAGTHRDTRRSAAVALGGLGALALLAGAVGLAGFGGGGGATPREPAFDPQARLLLEATQAPSPTATPAVVAQPPAADPPGNSRADRGPHGDRDDKGEGNGKKKNEKQDEDDEDDD